MSKLDQDLSGKVYVVTGANSGIGFEASRNFAARGARVVLICRSKEKGDAALAKIEQETGNDQVRLYVADISSLEEVSALADRLLEDFLKIDVLCNNAGSANGRRTETREGFETTFVTNHLSGFLLTKKLMPALERASTSGLARVVFTSSYGHENSPLDFDDLGLNNGYKTLTAYGRSKLMNLLTARELQRRVGNHNIVSSSFHPGAVRTPIWRKGGLLARTIGVVIYPFMVSVEKGADTFIWLASSDDSASVNADGNYFYKRRKVKIAAHATDADAERLWDVSEELVRPFV
ncbi:MAG: SDR family oxidoreductase [Proteobacteria bacterium]|nr:SDR family oxidoreductase [Pseudomonadota bacterium]MDA0895200.1 SDR family oxidoreductase [Pseudomonadota bacterium]MDA1245327.1 SDR family oxidoreductase [Pseudomonadota bacterium]